MDLPEKEGTAEKAVDLANGIGNNLYVSTLISPDVAEKWQVAGPWGALFKA